MKYKRIKNMLHNLSKSFIEGLHFVKSDNIPAVEELCDLLKSGRYEIVSFDFLNQIADPSIHSDEVMSLFKKYIDDHDRLIQAHGLEKDKLEFVQFTISKAKKGFTFKATARDDRGVHHEYVT